VSEAYALEDAVFDVVHVEGLAFEVDALRAQRVAFSVLEQRDLFLFLLREVVVERFVVEDRHRVADELGCFLVELFGALALFVPGHQFEERVFEVDCFFLGEFDAVFRAVAHEVFDEVAGEFELEDHLVEQSLDQTAELLRGGLVQLRVAGQLNCVLRRAFDVFLEHVEDQVLELFDESVEVGRGESLVEEEVDVVFDEHAELVEGDFVDEDHGRVVWVVPGGVEAFGERAVDGVDADEVCAGPASGVGSEEVRGEDVFEVLDEDVWLEHLVVLDVEERFVELLEVREVYVLQRVDLHLDQVFGVFGFGLDLLRDLLEVLLVLDCVILGLADFDQVDVGLVDFVLVKRDYQGADEFVVEVFDDFVFEVFELDLLEAEDEVDEE